MFRPMSEDTRIVAEFESLGDNCEFGFVQRYHGVESGGLLRWASSNLAGLILALEQRFAGIYQLSDLAPYTVNMVIDRKYGIAFHSAMRSAVNNDCLEYALTDGVLDAIHREEHEKISYLVNKLTDALCRGDRIFVYKRNGGLSFREIIRLRRALDNYGKSRLLCVVPAYRSLPPGKVKLVGPGIKLAGIEKLAPYEEVELALYEQWTSICRDAYRYSWG
jgi:hypothetical protein